MDIARSLWSGLDVEKLSCCHCDKSISGDAVLARTFTIQEPGISDKPGWSEKIQVPSLSKEFLVYHRHLECLQEATPYVTVSHVWHPEVAQLQYQGHGEPAQVAEATKRLLETPTLICKALADVGEKVEVWHDYISVPQWQHEIKGRIIQNIPRIFNHAKFVLMHLSDVDRASVQAMRHGTSTEQVVRGISNVCNARYFSRVWTAMEYTQSRDVRVILKDYIWVEPSPKYQFFIVEFTRTWDGEVVKHDHPITLEKMANMGYNLVPWQLGPLQGLRNQDMNDQMQPMFATAYELLSRRNVTLERDFFHALIGTLKLNSTLAESKLSHDNREALMQVAKHCLKHGDLSPLFMIPAVSQNEPDDAVLQQYGYLDTLTWGIGEQLEPATFKDVRIESEDVILKAEELGTFKPFGENGRAGYRIGNPFQ
jgi:hypothetical protein